jgi:hypothetical protein
VLVEVVFRGWAAAGTDQDYAGGHEEICFWHVGVLGAPESSREQMRVFFGRTFCPHRLVVDAISFSVADFLHLKVSGMPGLTSLLSLSTTDSSLAVIDCCHVTVKWGGCARGLAMIWQVS